MTLYLLLFREEFGLDVVGDVGSGGVVGVDQDVVIVEDGAAKFFSVFGVFDNCLKFSSQTYLDLDDPFQGASNARNVRNILSGLRNM